MVLLQGILAFILLIFTLFMLIGTINPKWINGDLTKKQKPYTRKKALMLFLFFSFLSMACMGVFSSSNSHEENTVVTDTQPSIIAKMDGINIPGNGTFTVNDEIKPGIYKSIGIIYWARLSGFSGETKEILANENVGIGPTIVEIKPTDKGFRTVGSGKWVLLDISTYSPAKLTEFGEGTYIVGKDINPGKYKSDGSVSYWKRMSSFSGDSRSIIANKNSNGPDIVEIKSTDVGFQTRGGKWKMVE